MNARSCKNSRDAHDSRKRVVGLFERAAARPPEPSDFPSCRKWEGVWIGEHQQPDINGFPVPRRSAHAEALQAGRLRSAVERGESGPIPRSAGRSEQAKGGELGYPMMMNSSAPMQFIITPEETLIINIYRDVRHVHCGWSRASSSRKIAGRRRGATPSANGMATRSSSRTIGVQSPPEHFFIAPPLSVNARYVERLRMTAPGRIEADITIEDPATLTQPWKVKMVYVHPEGSRPADSRAFGNDRTGFDGESLTLSRPK